MTSLGISRMNDDLFEDVPPPYQRNSLGIQDLETSHRNRSISTQIPQSLPANIFTRDRVKSVQPTTTSKSQIPSTLYPSLSDADRLFAPVDILESECTSIEVYLKEIWEAGYGVHTGIFKKLSKIVDNGGETSWRTVKLEWINEHLILHENPKSNQIQLKHSVIGIDRNCIAHPHTLTIQQVNGKIMKFGFPNADSFNSWQIFLINKQKTFK